MSVATEPPDAAHAFAARRDRVQSAVLAAYPEQIARMAWDRDRIRVHQRERLRELLGHAAEHSPFHARRLAGVDLDAVGPDDLTALPVLTKAELMAGFDAAVTDRRVTRATAEAALARTVAEPRPLPGDHVAFTTGGSSGERGVFVHDVDATVQFVGAVTRALVARLAATGGPPPGGLPTAMVAASSAVHLTGAAPAFTAGGRMPVRYLPVPVTLALPEMVARLNTMAPAMLFGYPTALARLAAERRAGRLRIAPVAVTCSSETCTPELRAEISAGFGVPVVDAFASTEGLVGATVPDGDVLTLAEDGCVVELVDAVNRPVPPGTPSAKVLVTNLYNRVQPLIRYELADSMVEVPGGGGHLRVRVQGRADEEFRYGAVAVHPLVVRSVLVRSAGVEEYQVRQTARGIDVAAVAPGGLDRTGMQERLRAALAAAGLARPEVTVATVAALPRHPETGKLRRFVPLT